MTIVFKGAGFHFYLLDNSFCYRSVGTPTLGIEESTPTTEANAEVYGIYKVPERKKLPFDYDKKTVNKIFNDASVLTPNTEVYVGSLNKQLVSGKELIGLLKKEYHLN